MRFGCAFLCLFVLWVHHPSKAISCSKGGKRMFYKSVLFFPCNSVPVHWHLAHDLWPCLFHIDCIFSHACLHWMPSKLDWFWVKSSKRFFHDCICIAILLRWHILVLGNLSLVFCQPSSTNSPNPCFCRVSFESWRLLSGVGNPYKHLKLHTNHCCLCYPPKWIKGKIVVSHPCQFGAQLIREPLQPRLHFFAFFRPFNVSEVIQFLVWQ